MVPRPSQRRELYIDAFRGLMALVMVQGHVFETLLAPAARALPLYQFQVMFHGSTAPGFLFASGFVAGLPRAPLSGRAGLRRARRLLFVLGVGYALHLPFLSAWKTGLEATAAERAALFACDALQVIAVSQLLVLLLQWLAGPRWTRLAGGLAGAVIVASPLVWASHLSARVHPALGAYLDASARSVYPVFPFAAFVLAGTLAGALIGRQAPRVRRRRALGAGISLLALGTALSFPLAGRVDFWGPSPAYALIRLGGLTLLLAGVEYAADHEWPLVGTLALLGHETLQVFVLHLVLLYGWLLGPAPLGPFVGRMGFSGAFLVLLGMLPVLYGAAWAWHRLKVRAPHEAQLALSLVTVAFVYEFLTRPW